MRKYIIIVILCILLVGSTACHLLNDNLINTNEEDNPSNLVDSSPSNSPLLSAIPVEIPTKSPTPIIEYLELQNVILQSDINAREIDLGNLVEYVGEMTLIISFNDLVPIDIKESIYIDNKLIESDLVKIKEKQITITLSDNLPNNYLFLIKSKLEKENSIDKDLLIFFKHNKKLTCNISLADPQVANLPERPGSILYNPIEFSYSFNRSVLKDSIIFPEYMNEYDFTLNWESDQKLLLTLSDFKDKQGRVGLKHIKGMTTEANDEIVTNTIEENSYEFSVGYSKGLYAIDLENDKRELLYNFKYSMTYEDISDDKNFISLGLLTDTEYCYSYRRAIYDVKNNNLSYLDNIENDLLSELMDKEIITTVSDYLYSILQNEYWDNNGNYHFFYDHKTYTINPETFDTQLLYNDEEQLYYNYPIYHLDNGTIVKIKKADSSDGFLFMTLVDEAGNIYAEYKTPFKEKSDVEGIKYLVDVKDAGNNKLFITGYEFIDERNTINSYLLDLSDGSMKHIHSGGYLLGYFKETGFAIYRGTKGTSEYENHTFISIEDEKTTNIFFRDTVFSNLVYSEYNNCYYMKQYDLQYRDFYIIAIDATSFEVTRYNEQIGSGRLIGVNELGQLIVMR